YFSYYIVGTVIWSKSWTPSAFDITHRKKDRFSMTTEAAEIIEKLKDKRAEYEAIASSDSSVNLDNIDNRYY
ncbi:hypothetical protein Gotur_021434, partial [Gossypium turneri]